MVESAIGEQFRSEFRQRFGDGRDALALGLHGLARATEALLRTFDIKEE